MALEVLREPVNALFGLFFGIGISAYAVYAGMKLFDKLTPHIDEWKELKKGNVAVALVLSAVVFSIGLLMEKPFSLVISILAPGTTLLNFSISVLVALLITLVSLLLSTLLLFISVRLIDSLTTDINEMAELKKGNVAIALVLSFCIVAIAFLTRGALFDVVFSLHLSSLATIVLN